MKRWKQPLILAILALVGVVVFLASRGPGTSAPKTAQQPTPAIVPEKPTIPLVIDDIPAPAPPPPLTAADLRPPPDWSRLDRFQNTMMRDRFKFLLENVYTKDQSYREFVTINADHALIQTPRAEQKTYRVAFSTLEKAPQPPPALDQLHVAIDPGHIGGDFAEMEERHLDYGDHRPIREGEMTLRTARHLRKLLEARGAKVTLVRKKNAPVLNKPPSAFATQKLFYRTAEIHARGKLVNETIKPDLVVCLHFNATGSPIPVPGQDFHVLVNGTYHPSELSQPDELFSMLWRLLSDYYATELPLAEHTADAFERHTDLPPYRYPSTNPFAQNLAENPYLWARNLLASRLYHAPVIFLEPYTQNSTEFVERFRLGDYSGYQVIDGTPRRSLYREYAHAVADAIQAHYAVNPTSAALSR